MSGIDVYSPLVPDTFIALLALLIAALSFGVTEAGAQTRDDALPHLELISFPEPPYVFESDLYPSDGIKGLATEIVDALLARTEISYHLKLMPPKRAIIYTSQTPNACVFPIERNQEREVQFTWISPILVSRSGLYPLADRPIERDLLTLSDVANLRIGSHLGSATGEYLDSLGYKVDSAARGDANAYKLQLNRVDLWASDAITAAYTAKTSGIKLGPSALNFFTTLRAIGCHPSVDSRLIEKIRSRLYGMYQDGTIDSINNRLEKMITNMPEPKTTP